MIAEGASEHGAVFVSDALSFVDRSYGGLESEVLFDLDKAGELLSVLGNRDARKVLRVIYHKKITEGESSLTPEEIAAASGLTVEAVLEAVVQLRHVALVDEIETIQQDGYKKEYSMLFTKDYVSVIAILRLAHINVSDETYTTLMYKGVNESTYEGPGL